MCTLLLTAETPCLRYILLSVFLFCLQHYHKYSVIPFLNGNVCCSHSIWPVFKTSQLPHDKLSHFKALWDILLLLVELLILCVFSAPGEV